MKRTLLGLGLIFFVAAPVVAAPIEFKPAPPAAPPPSEPAPPAKKPTPPPPSSPTPPAAAPPPSPPPPPLAPGPGDRLLPPSPDAPQGPPPPLAPSPADALPVPSQAYPPPPSAAPPLGPPAPADAPADTALPPAGAVPPGSAPPAPAYPPPGPYPGYPPAPYPGYPPGYPPGYYGGYSYPPPPPPVQGIHTHDGFYLRLVLGFGPSNLTLDNPTSKIEVTGITSTFSLSLGAALTPRLVVFGELVGVGASKPTLKIDGTDQGSQTGNYSLGGLGAGVAYYFMPQNVYLAASVALVNLQFDNLLEMRVAKDSGNGGLGRLIVAKEWWVSDNWGVGVGGQLMLGGIKAQKTDNPDLALATGTWKFSSLSVFASATFN